MSVVSDPRLVTIERLSPMINDCNEGMVRDGIVSVDDLTPSMLSGQIKSLGHVFVISSHSSVPSTNTSVIFRLCAKRLCILISSMIQSERNVFFMVAKHKKQKDCYLFLRL